MKSIILEGYYNKGNFGDDLLMITSSSLLKEMNVAFRMKKEDLIFFNNYVCEESQGNENIIIKGGGGLYFDFEKKGLIKDRLLNYILSFSIFRKLAVIYFNKNKKILLLGVGIGPYTQKSNRLWTHLLDFQQVKLFCLRDKESIQVIQNKRFNNNIIQVTDLVFNVELWKNYVSSKKTSIKKSKVGIILRRWKFYKINYKEIIDGIINQYGKENVTFFFLEQEDEVLKEEFVSLKVETYKKGNENYISQFINSLLEVDLIYTMRAHGAIVASCLNIPSVILPIEKN